MAEPSDYLIDSTFTLELSPPDRPGAATDICIRIDDGADIVVDIGSRTNGRIKAYLTMDETEDLVNALRDILRVPSDRTGSIEAFGSDR